MATQHIGGLAEKELEPGRPDWPFLLADRATWRVDGLILPDEPHGRGNGRDHASLSGKRGIVIQPRVGPMGMLDGPSTLFRALAVQRRFVCAISRMMRIAPVSEVISRSRSLGSNQQTVGRGYQD